MAGNFFFQMQFLFCPFFFFCMGGWLESVKFKSTCVLDHVLQALHDGKDMYFMLQVDGHYVYSKGLVFFNFDL